uniref:Uncharacterized protein n=1 Tax=Panagrolaimus sp. ES5 TaxID=591445 RepID=A0AC34FWW4_9BILA
MATNSAEDNPSIYCKCAPPSDIPRTHKITGILVDEEAVELYFEDTTFKKVVTLDYFKRLMLRNDLHMKLQIVSHNSATASTFLENDDLKYLAAKSLQVNFRGHYKRSTVLYFLRAGIFMEHLKMDVVIFE